MRTSSIALAVVLLLGTLIFTEAGAEDLGQHTIGVVEKNDLWCKNEDMIRFAMQDPEDERLLTKGGLCGRFDKHYYADYDNWRHPIKGKKQEDPTLFIFKIWGYGDTENAIRVTGVRYVLYDNGMN